MKRDTSGGAIHGLGKQGRSVCLINAGCAGEELEGLAMMTPADVHADLADERWLQRKQTLRAAYERHPERFVRGEPSPRQVPEEVWINKPKEVEAAG